MRALRVENLRIAFGDRIVVDNVSFDVRPGECLAIVGESGAGKSVTAAALLGLLPRDAAVTATALEVDGIDAAHLSEPGWRSLRGARIALVSQDALVSVDPLRRVEREVVEAIEVHKKPLSRSARRSHADELLTAVAMPDPRRRARQFPHELSGGLRQRALIASALAADPAVIIADEPTTALDATVQARVLTLLREIVDRGVAIVFISHDLAAVARVADRVAVMQHGQIVETGPVTEVLSAPQHPHTKTLVAAARRSPRAPRELVNDIVLEARGVSKAFDRVAVSDVSFTLPRGRTLAVVGESGSGKTTLARLLLGVEKADAGQILRDGELWRPGTGDSSSVRVQLVHQNPLGAFDPRWSIGRSLKEALTAAGVPRTEQASHIARLLRDVGLDLDVRTRQPRQLSGGQRQRAAIARALATDPDVLVLDEPVSALDAPVRERVLLMLQRIQAERNLAMLFISHDLGVVASISDDVLVMRDGMVVEAGATSTVFANPKHPFTRELLAASGTSASTAKVQKGE
ncbi:ABC transporter ATP-binding protein [Microbacterium sp. NPDC076911]|uniref:ABC transporter ATP-binding protein n=1 Tax=Microbacterium sp. NPDC076911 TaxID=3154958 RepID=UPI003440788A